MDKLFADKQVTWEGEIREINYPASRFSIAGAWHHVAATVKTPKETVMAISTDGRGRLVSGRWWKPPYERVR